MAERSHLLQLTTKLENLLLHHLLVFDSLEDDLQARQVDRLGDVVLGAHLQRPHRGVDRGVAGENDDGDVRIRLLHAVQEVEAGAVGELEIDDGHIGHELVDGGPTGFHRVGHLGLVAPLFNDIRHAGAGSPVIVDDEDSFHYSPGGSLSRSNTLSLSSDAFSSPPYVSAMSRAAASDRSGLPCGSL